MYTSLIPRVIPVPLPHWLQPAQKEGLPPLSRLDGQRYETVSSNPEISLIPEKKFRLLIKTGYLLLIIALYS